MKTEQTRNWEYREGTTPHYQGQIYDENGKTVAISYDDEGGHIARLAAAAPALLEALRGMIDMVTDNRTHGKEIDIACEVIRQAEGVQS